MRAASSRRTETGPAGAARWWWNAALGVTLRMAAFVWLVVILATGQADHHYFWLAVVGAVLMGLLLVPRLAVCVLALVKPEQLD